MEADPRPCEAGGAPGICRLCDGIYGDQSGIMGRYQEHSQHQTSTAKLLVSCSTLDCHKEYSVNTPWDCHDVIIYACIHLPTHVNCQGLHIIVVLNKMVGPEI